MKHLYNLRKKRGITQRIAAELMGFATTVYQRWEAEEREPQFNNAIKIAKFYNVSLDYLAGFTDDPTPRTIKKHKQKQTN